MTAQGPEVEPSPPVGQAIASATPASAQAAQGGVRARLRFADLRRRALWPFWLAIALFALSLMTDWVASSSFFYDQSCPVGSIYCTRLDPLESGGGGAADVTLPIVALAAASIIWGSARRDLPLPRWFNRIPAVILLAGLIVAILHLPAAIPDGLGVLVDANSITTASPGWGAFIFLVALLPLFVGFRRLERLDNVQRV
jgi:hypothetical protein